MSWGPCLLWGPGTSTDIPASDPAVPDLLSIAGGSELLGTGLSPPASTLVLLSAGRLLTHAQDFALHGLWDTSSHGASWVAGTPTTHLGQGQFPSQQYLLPHTISLVSMVSLLSVTMVT